MSNFRYRYTNEKIIGTFVLLCLLSFGANAQSIYFPPASGSWDTLSPQRYGWCTARIDSLYNYLQVKNTKSFILLIDGKIVLEKYFGTYTQDSIWYWASASKSLAGFITGLAVQKGLVAINQPASQYMGTGWSSAPLAKENLITVKHLLSMTSGLEDGPPAPCDNEDSAKACLLYKVDAGTRWAYHTGAYKKVQEVVADAAGLNYNAVTQQWLKNKIGMGGLWIDQTYYSKARDMARFGILNLAQGKWLNDTVMKDTAYFSTMTRTSQAFNQSYGYLWWLNGKNTYMNPGLQLQLPGPLIPNAPSDLYAALGKNDQKIYVVPSTQMIVVRQGNSAEGVTFALSSFDNKMWAYINALTCNLTGIVEQEEAVSAVFPNPASESITIKSKSSISDCSVSDVLGRGQVLPVTSNTVSLQSLECGLYYIIALNGRSLQQPIKFVKQH